MTSRNTPALFDLGESMRRPKRPATPFSIGTGPAGETCGTCADAVLRPLRSRNYWKCAAAKNAWTNSQNSDIRLKWPACRAWKPKAAAAAGGET